MEDLTAKILLLKTHLEKEEPPMKRYASNCGSAITKYLLFCGEKIENLKKPAEEVEDCEDTRELEYVEAEEEEGEEEDEEKEDKEEGEEEDKEEGDEDVEEDNDDKELEWTVAETLASVAAHDV